MTTDDLTAALRARSVGIYPLEAGTELLIGNGTFLHRDDFHQPLHRNRNQHQR